MSDCEYYIHRSCDIIDDILDVQEEINECYDDIGCNNFSINKQRIIGLFEKQNDLKEELISYLNELFKIKPKRFLLFKNFRLKQDSFVKDRYFIVPPMGLDKTSKEFVVLKKALVESHRKHFLQGGIREYLLSNEESHMWEIPNFVNYNELLRTLVVEANAKRRLKI